MTFHELFRAADGALLSSAWENFPHSVVEALAVGTPVIATDVGGVREAVEDGKRMPYKVVKRDNGDVGIEVHGKTYSPPEVGAHVQHEWGRF